MHVLVVDDHPLFRQGLRALLMGLESSAVVLEAGTVREAVALAGEVPAIDLVLLDMSLPDGRDVAALRVVKEAFESVPVVVVSGDESPTLMRAALEAGASGYVPKSTDPSLTVGALRVVLAHGVYLPPHLMLTLPSGDSAPARRREAPVFSQRQRDVLGGLLHGKSNKAIARELAIAEGTVKAHLWAIYQALGVTSRTMAMFRAHELGLLEHAVLAARETSGVASR